MKRRNWSLDEKLVIVFEGLKEKRSVADIYLLLFLIIVNLCIDAHGANANGVMNISNNEGISGYPDIDIHQQDIYVVWADDTPGTFLIYFSKYSGNWSEPSPISTAIGGTLPKVIVDSENIYTVWQGNNGIYYAKYDSIWSAPSQIPKSNGGEVPDIDIKGNKIFVVWEKDDDIYFCRYDTIWSDTTKLSNSTYDAANPRIVVESGIVHVIWEETITFSPLVCEIYYARYDGEWTEPLNISNAGNSDSGRPCIGVHNGIIHVLWDDDVFSTAAEICYSFYETSWSTPLNISNSTSGSLSPSISVKNDTIHAVWYEYVSDNFEIAYCKRIGGSWTQPENISNTTGWSWFPSISNDEDSIYIVWSDNTPSNYDIYFCSFSSGSSIDEETIDSCNNFTISYNYPNPFNTTTIINYVLTKDSHVELRIYNSSGQFISTLMSGYQGTGNHSILWNGRNMKETVQPSGVFFYELRIGNKLSKNGRIVLLK